MSAGEITLHDLKRDPTSFINKPFYMIMFYLSRDGLDAIAERQNARRIADLFYRPGASVRDPVVSNLGTSMRAALERPEQASRVFTDHVLLVVAAHVAHTYGCLVVRSQATRAGLAAWQERQAKEMLAEHLDGDVTPSELAAACKLSIAHFARAFRRSTGFAPHQWLLHRRVEVANSDRSLTEVALDCGFADQSHFTQVFSRLVGISPGAWRRANVE